MYTRATSLPNLYITYIIPGDKGMPLPEHLALSGWGEASINGHLADASTVDALYSSTQGRGRIRSFLV